MGQDALLELAGLTACLSRTHVAGRSMDAPDQGDADASTIRAPLDTQLGCRSSGDGVSGALHPSDPESMTRPLVSAHRSISRPSAGVGAIFRSDWSRIFRPLHEENWPFVAIPIDRSRSAWHVLDLRSNEAAPSRTPAAAGAGSASRAHARCRVPNPSLRVSPAYRPCRFRPSDLFARCDGYRSLAC